MNCKYRENEPPNQLNERPLCDRRVAQLPTGIKRRFVRYAHDGMLVPLATGFPGRGCSPLLSSVGSEAAIRSAHRTFFRCDFGAISVEKMEIMDSVDVPELTPSREKTEKPP